MKIFIDLDGTLLDIKYRCYQIYFDLLSCGGFECLNIEKYWEMKRNKISEEEIVSETATTLFVKHYSEKRFALIETMEYLVLDNVFSCVHGVLNAWSAAHDLYLVTLRKNRTHLDLQLYLLDLYKYFKFVYNDEMSRNEKADLVKYEIFDTSDCVIIGDTEDDIEAGKSLGIKTIALTSGIRKKDLLRKLYPDILVRDISQVNIEEVLNG